VPRKEALSRDSGYWGTYVESLDVCITRGLDGGPIKVERRVFVKESVILGVVKSLGDRGGIPHDLFGDTANIDAGSLVENGMENGMGGVSE
jgi:hypothetical protein